MEMARRPCPGGGRAGRGRVGNSGRDQRPPQLRAHRRGRPSGEWQQGQGAAVGLRGGRGPRRRAPLPHHREGTGTVDRDLSVSQPCCYHQRSKGRQNRHRRNRGQAVRADMTWARAPNPAGPHPALKAETATSSSSTVTVAVLAARDRLGQGYNGRPSDSPASCPRSDRDCCGAHHRAVGSPASFRTSLCAVAGIPSRPPPRARRRGHHRRCPLPVMVGAPDRVQHAHGKERNRGPG